MVNMHGSDLQGGSSKMHGSFFSLFLRKCSEFNNLCRIILLGKLRLCIWLCRIGICLLYNVCYELNLLLSLEVFFSTTG